MLVVKNKQTNKQTNKQKKHLPANPADLRGASLIPESGRVPEGGHGNPFQYSCLENPMDRGDWRATSP